jgi:hypothetical protein
MTKSAKQLREPHLIDKQKRKKVVAAKSTSNSLTFTLLEEDMHLATILHYKIAGRNIGAALLKTGKSNTPRYKILFPFEINGVHPDLRPEEIESVFNSLASGFREIPDQETMTIHFSSFIDETSRQNYLTDIGNSSTSDKMKMLIMSKKKKIHDLHLQGARNLQTIHVWCSYTISEKEKVSGIDKIFQSLFGFANKAAGGSTITQSEALHDFIGTGYQSGYLFWQQSLANRFGLIATPLNPQQVWQQLWLKFNRFTSPVACPVPQTIVFDGIKLSTKIISNLSPRSILLKSSKSVPECHRDTLKVDGRYLAVLPLISKPEGFADEMSEMCYYWDALMTQGISDFEITSDVRSLNQAQFRENAVKLTRQAISTQAVSEQKGGVSVIGAINQEAAQDIQADLYRGERVLSFGTVVTVYASRKQDLQRICQRIESRFMYPASLERDNLVAWFTWLNTLPVTWGDILSYPSNRRLKVYSGDACAFVPMAAISSRYKSGYEFLSAQGGVPVYLDFIKSHQNLAIFAKTRFGKSIVLGDIITEVLAAGLPVSIIDYPPADDVSSFEDLADFLDGGYGDVVKSANNPFELPDLSDFKGDKERLESRKQSFRAYLKAFLATMILGVSPNAINQDVSATVVDGILTFALSSFFSDQSILERYSEAVKGGIGSPQWNNYPTLEDFCSFCTLERLGGDKYNTAQIRYVRDQLLRWCEGRFSKSLNSPSTISTNEPLFVMALRDISDDNEAAVLSSLMLLTILRRSFKYPESLIVLDEASIACDLPPVAKLVGEICANGAKAGYRVILSAQSPTKVFGSVGGPNIIANLTGTLVGAITPSAITSFLDTTSIPEEMLQYNASESFVGNRAEGYTPWLYSDGSRNFYVRAYPSDLLLKLASNNRFEIKERRDVLAKYPTVVAGVAALLELREHQKQTVNT